MADELHHLELWQCECGDWVPYGTAPNTERKVLTHVSATTHYIVVRLGRKAWKPGDFPTPSQ